ncbi:MAG: 30S ribosomal protein S20 [Clostridia bacterium]|uniref:Small ribosomal subunit protein bS20 n=1 Tax=Proteiniclasticum aestuarii TaxID=2817862 RepID=A0A939HA22_9CLOT|nr:30S ribosomal protein S20 [Proteiniclasticum aestuarii]NCC79266.1 30S ribosomal protein S20 [Clostridia bacterium]
MANIKSAKKRIKVTQTKTLRNKMVKSALKTSIKKYETAIEAGNVDEAKVLLGSAIKSIDMAASKGIIHKNVASRKKSRLTLKLNKLA